jgi:hypothetical protein
LLAVKKVEAAEDEPALKSSNPIRIAAEKMHLLIQVIPC